MRFLVPAVALVAALLAGPGFAPLAPLSGAALPGGPFEAADPSASVELTSYGAIHTLGTFGGEPNIAVGPAGDAFVTFPGWVWGGTSWQGGTFVYRQPQGAGAFTFAGVPNRGLGGNDEALAIAPDGTVWISGMYGYPSACASSTRSTTNGAGTFGGLWPPLSFLLRADAPARPQRHRAHGLQKDGMTPLCALWALCPSVVMGRTEL